MFVSVLKWICFIIIFLDAVGYIITSVDKVENIPTLIGLCIGVAARAYVLYGACAYWVLT